MSIISRTANLLDLISGSSMTRLALNHILKDYGQVTYIRINKFKQQLDLSIHLHGDHEPVEIRVEKYDISTKGSSATFRIDQLKSDRIWLNRLLNDLVVGNSIDIPPGEYSNILEELLIGPTAKAGLA